MPPLFQTAALVPPPAPVDHALVLMVMVCLTTAASLLACILIWRFSARFDPTLRTASPTIPPLPDPDEGMLATTMPPGSFAVGGFMSPDDRTAILRERSRRQRDRDASALTGTASPLPRTHPLED